MFLRNAGEPHTYEKNRFDIVGFDQKRGLKRLFMVNVEVPTSLKVVPK